MDLATARYRSNRPLTGGREGTSRGGAEELARDDVYGAPVLEEGDLTDGLQPDPGLLLTAQSREENRFGRLRPRARGANEPAKQSTIVDVWIGVLPFMVCMAVVIGLVLAFPGIALRLPDLVYGSR